MILRDSLFKHQSGKLQRKTRSFDVWRYRAVLAVLLLGVSAGAVRAESLTAGVVVLSSARTRVKILGERTLATRVWSFRNVYAGAMNLGERIENLELADAAGVAVPVRRLAPGEYEAASAATRFSYEMNLDAPLFETDAAHVSWLTNERGFLMMGDLLPLAVGEKGLTKTSATLRFSLPPNWTIATTERAGGANWFEVADAENALFFVGENLREKRQRVGAMEFAYVTAGEWAFSDEEVADLAASILKDHVQTFGGIAQGRTMLMLAPFPRPAAADHWSAETRGATVLLLAGKSPSKTAALAQLSYPLAHELFHLWIPNGLALDGDYDWFYEGFTLYQALRAAVRLNLLTFQDYLNALGRAFDAYKSAQGREQLSLLEASKQRWTLSPALVYNKGMLAAFLYDLGLRQKTKGKRSLDDVYRELFRQSNASQGRRDGNQTALAALNNAGEMQDVTRLYIESASVIDLPTAIAPFGLRLETGSVRTRIAVADSLSGAQRDLLRKFGYNEKLDGTHRRIARPRANNFRSETN
jgi:predicted metalloprotease with PDZ domain